MLTGESKPVPKKSGEKVIGSSINGEGAIVAEITKTGSETYLSQVIELVMAAQESKPRTQGLANRAAFLLTVTAISAGAITFAGWLLVGETTSFAVEKAVTVMVISCPHALGLAIPLVVAVSTSLAATSGLLIRERQAFKRAKDLKAVVFDKTGTLTEGRFGVVDILPLAELGEDEVLRLGASLESSSERPIARGIVDTAKARQIELRPVEGFRAIPGKGIEGRVYSRPLRMVSPGYLSENRVRYSDPRVDRLKEQGKTVVFLVEGEKLLGAVALADIVRRESREAVATLKGMGLKFMMLTGDNRYVAKWVSEELGLDEYLLRCFPMKSLRRLRGFRSVMLWLWWGSAR